MTKDKLKTLASTKIAVTISLMLIEPLRAPHLTEGSSARLAPFRVGQIAWIAQATLGRPAARQRSSAHVERFSAD